MATPTKIFRGASRPCGSLRTLGRHLDPAFLVRPAAVATQRPIRFIDPSTPRPFDPSTQGLHVRAGRFADLSERLVVGLFVCAAAIGCGASDPNDPVFKGAQDASAGPADGDVTATDDPGMLVVDATDAIIDSATDDVAETWVDTASAPEVAVEDADTALVSEIVEEDAKVAPEIEDEVTQPPPPDVEVEAGVDVAPDADNDDVPELPEPIDVLDAPETVVASDIPTPADAGAPDSGADQDIPVEPDVPVVVNPNFDNVAYGVLTLVGCDDDVTTCTPAGAWTTEKLQKKLTTSPVEAPQVNIHFGFVHSAGDTTNYTDELTLVPASAIALCYQPFQVNDSSADADYFQSFCGPGTTLHDAATDPLAIAATDALLYNATQSDPSQRLAWDISQGGTPIPDIIGTPVIAATLYNTPNATTLSTAAIGLWVLNYDCGVLQFSQFACSANP